MSQTLDVSVIVVNYYAGQTLERCVGSALDQAGEIIVVDNDSSDGSVERLVSAFSNATKLRIVRNHTNIGFAKACNIGVRIAVGQYLLFLNPDCVLEPEVVLNLLRAMEGYPDTAMVGGFLANPDGSEQGGGRRAVPTPWRSFVRAFGLWRLSDRYPRLFSDFLLHKQPLPDHPIEVEAISGACMLVRRDALKDVGPLDEGYFMHCEDLDWCMRFRQKGWRILFVPDAKVVHYKGTCSKTRPIFVEWHKHKGMMRFYLKFFRHQYPGVLMWLVGAGVWLRFGAMAIYYSLRHVGRWGLGVAHDAISLTPTPLPEGEGLQPNHVGVLGATSLVGACLLPLLTEAGWQVTAFSRRAVGWLGDGVAWRQLPLAEYPSPQPSPQRGEGVTPHWICVAPIWVLPDYFGLLDAQGARRVVVLSSTSRFTKDDSSDPEEQTIALRLADAEARVQAWAKNRGVEWVILRPTLIYGLGRDKNIAEIARFIRRFGFFPLFGKANGLRQPIHAADVAGACLAALQAPCAANRGYNISGGETLTYRNMVARVFSAIGRPPRLLTVPLWAFRLAVTVLRRLPRYRQWSAAMAERMNRDLVFDHAEVARDLGFKPRAFVLAAGDLPT